MRSSRPSLPPVETARHKIATELAEFLDATRVRRVYVAGAGLVPPPLAYVTPFARLSIPLKGRHAMEIAAARQAKEIHPSRGDVVFVPPHTWNRPDWSAPATVLTVLVSAKQIGASLVSSNGQTELPVASLKTSVHGSYDGPIQQILRALTSTITDRSPQGGGTSPGAPLPRLLVESLLHACLQQLTLPATQAPRKATRSYEAICLYVQEHYQHALTREMVARHFGLAPTHVSRLFRREGLMRFNDYVNFVRVNRAKFLLRTYGIPLKEIAAHCGYSDVAYFCQVFKRLNAVTPTQYRDAEPPSGTAAPRG